MKARFQTNRGMVEMEDGPVKVTTSPDEMTLFFPGNECSTYYRMAWGWNLMNSTLEKPLRDFHSVQFGAREDF